MKYDKPETDGGSPVMGYNAEVKNVRNSNWLKIGPEETLIKDMGFNFIGGIEGTEVIFRVNAENLAGVGEWSLDSNAIIFK